MKLAHDIENDLEHTIPPEGGWDSRRLFQVMTERSLALLELGRGSRVLDLACGMGQDTLTIAGRLGGAAGSGTEKKGVAVGLEPSNRMIRFAQMRMRAGQGEGGPLPAAGAPGRGVVRFCRALGEELPFRAESFDGVLCKGALDHFMAPPTAMAEIARVLRPGGKAVIALANYDSLSCRLGRRVEGLKTRLVPGYRPSPHPYFEPPPDHLTRFGYGNIAALPRPPLSTTRLEGVSLLWGLPGWATLLASLPGPLGRTSLAVAFLLGRVFPRLADVVLVQAVKQG